MRPSIRRVPPPALVGFVQGDALNVFERRTNAVVALEITARSAGDDDSDSEGGVIVLGHRGGDFRTLDDVGVSPTLTKVAGTGALASCGSRLAPDVLPAFAK